MPCLFPLLLLGCTPQLGLDDPRPGADADTDVDADTDTDTDADSDADGDQVEPVEVKIRDVTPALGTNAGGTVVVLTGDDLGGVDTVTFGTSEVAVLSANASSLSVETPETVRTGPVDISVEGTGITGHLADGFYFLEDRTGVSGGLGFHIYTRSIGYAVDDGDSGSSDLVLVDGIQDVDIHDWLGPSGSCVSSTPSGGDHALTDMGVTAIGLSSADGASLQLTLDEDGSFSAELGSASDYAASSPFDVGLAEGDWPAFTVTEGFTPGPTTAFTSPSLGTGSPEIGAGETFTWTPRGGDWMFISMALYWRDWWDSGYSHVENRRCLVQNTGSWTMPTDTWSVWPDHFWDYGYIDVTSGEIYVDLVPLPDGAEISWVSASLTHAGAYTKD